MHFYFLFIQSVVAGEGMGVETTISIEISKHTTQFLRKIKVSERPPLERAIGGERFGAFGAASQLDVVYMVLTAFHTHTNLCPYTPEAQHPVEKQLSPDKIFVYIFFTPKIIQEQKKLV